MDFSLYINICFFDSQHTAKHCSNAPAVTEPNALTVIIAAVAAANTLFS